MTNTVPVSVMIKEEESVIASAEKSVFGSGNPSIHGANGEQILLQFLDKYVPGCFRFTSGHALRADGEMSPQIDLMLVDSRFPPLSVHNDGTTLEMMEAVLSVVSVKKQLNKGEFDEQERYALKCAAFFAGAVENGKLVRNKYPPVFYVIVYHSKMLEERVVAHMETVEVLSNQMFTIFCLRMPEKDRKRGLGPGAIFRYDGIGKDVSLFSIFSTAPLSDFYFMMIQDAYYSMDEHYPKFKALGILLMKYYTWGRVDMKIVEADAQAQQMKWMKRQKAAESKRKSKT